jgi:UDPglucose 6-dehydrogenase
VASNPEFLREGCAIADSLYPDRIVTGAADKETLAVMQELYRPLVEQSFDPPPGVPRPAGLERVCMVTTTLTSAEMIKYAANAFLAMKIGFANEIANICEHVGAEAPEVMTGIGLDSRIGAKFLSPGVGWGGSCFGKDVLALLHTAREYGYDSRLLRASIEVNTAQRQMVIQKLQEKLFILKGRTIGLLGLAFKPDTDDLRDAPSLHIAERLLQMGARVKAYDPIAMNACREQRPDLRIRFCESALDVAAEADALVLVTEWREFRDLDLPALARAMARPILVDGRNLFSPTRPAPPASTIPASAVRRNAVASQRSEAVMRDGRTPGVNPAGRRSRTAWRPVLQAAGSPASSVTASLSSCLSRAAATSLIHLGMTGRLLLGGPVGKHTHAVLTLERGRPAVR